MALAAEQAPDGPAVVAVVCDGVSSSARPDEASQAAAQAALPVLVAAVRAGGDLGQASRAGVAVARQAIADLQGPGGDTSATTFVSAVASGYEVTLCWLGDSRAYWLGQPAEESRLLTRDDSVAGGMIAAGLVDEVRALRRLPHPISREACQALGYKELFVHLDGQCSLDQAVVQIKTRSRNFAKRQLTWFRHLPECRLVTKELTFAAWGVTMDG